MNYKKEKKKDDVVLKSKTMGELVVRDSESDQRVELDWAGLDWIGVGGVGGRFVCMRLRESRP